MRKRDYRNPRAADTYATYINDLSKLPFSFCYNGQSYKGFPSDVFPLINKNTDSVPGKDINHFELKADENLRIKIETAFYPAYGAYEWVVWFENTGSVNTGIIRDLWATDMDFMGEKPVLRGILGDHENFYKPYARDLTTEAVNFKSVAGGWPTHILFPYFNLEHGDGGSLIALGWGGTWEADFECKNGGTYFKGTGTNDLCTYLKPGEKIRSALVLVIPYTVRDHDYATNLWRSWFIHCNMPRKNAAGDPIQPFSTSCLCNDTGIPNSDGSISERSFTWKPSMEKMLAEGIKIDYRWFDAGWYYDPAGKSVEKDWWGTVGSWELDKEKWPGQSFRESVDWAHERDIKTFVWFEPERVTHVDDLVKHHGYKAEWALPSNHSDAIANNLGDSECLNWTLNRIIKMMEANDIDLYREDNNFRSASCWAARDDKEGGNRTGITENKCVTGHYALWDGIIDFCRRTGKNTFVDACASGGGRNDLESLRRGVPFMRSDYDRTTTALRLSMQTAFNNWVPFCGCSSVEQSGQLDPDGKRDQYIFRTSYNPVLIISAQWVHDPGTNFDMLRFGKNEWDSLKEYFLTEYYVLTKWNGPEDTSHWTSYMYYDPEKDSGVLFAFRMETAEAASCTVKLKMLCPDTMYAVKHLDTGEVVQVKGAELAKGFTITHDQPRSAALFRIDNTK